MALIFDKTIRINIFNINNKVTKKDKIRFFDALFSDLNFKNYTLISRTTIYEKEKLILFTHLEIYLIK
jgi:hypothetical protein